jgi:hypothetical protein
MLVYYYRIIIDRGGVEMYQINLLAIGHKSAGSSEFMQSYINLHTVRIMTIDYIIPII